MTVHHMNETGPNVFELYTGLQILHPDARWQNPRGSNGHYFVDPSTGLPITIGRFNNPSGMVHALVSLPPDTRNVHRRRMLEQSSPDGQATYTEEDGTMYLEGIGDTPEMLYGPQHYSSLAVRGLVRSTLQDTFLLSAVGRDKVWEAEALESVHALREFGRTVTGVGELAIRQVDDAFLAEILEASGRFVDI